MKALRVGVSRLREELAALLGVAVGEVAGPLGAARSSGPTRRGGSHRAQPAEPVLIGTEAVLHRVRRAAAVSFLDIDLHLLAPRLSATEETLSLLVRAGRLGRAAGVRSGHGPGCWRRPACRTTPCSPRPPRGNPHRCWTPRRRSGEPSGLPPFSALALVSGALAPAYAEALVAAATDEPPGLGDPARTRRGSSSRRLSIGELCDVWPAWPRPPGRGLRVEVDPTAL